MGLLGLERVYCDEAKTEAAVEADEALWVCFGGLPMGWSWGFYFCHEAFSQRCRRAMRAVQPTVQLLADRAPAPKLTAETGFFVLAWTTGT